ncbi:unnamed protein product [Clavelina lepadiformis]|uniref:Uncharacterized protein n=1 Tax=Clavelina lepadiformis TaxID=159417 RepID=A0ABP0GQG4_CLALP
MIAPSRPSPELDIDQNGKLSNGLGCGHPVMMGKAPFMTMLIWWESSSVAAGNKSAGEGLINAFMSFSIWGSVAAWFMVCFCGHQTSLYPKILDGHFTLFRMKPNRSRPNS